MGHLMTVKSPVSAPPCRLVTETRRYLIEGASAAMPLYFLFSFFLSNRASTISSVVVAVEERREGVVMK